MKSSEECLVAQKFKLIPSLICDDRTGGIKLSVYSRIAMYVQIRTPAVHTTLSPIAFIFFLDTMIRGTAV